MRLSDFGKRQKYGIPISIAVAVLIWLFVTTNKICAKIDPFNAPGYGYCESDSVIMWYIKHGTWPYSLGYLDPYLQLILVGILVYAVWFGISFYAKRKFVVSKKQH